MRSLCGLPHIIGKGKDFSFGRCHPNSGGSWIAVRTVWADGRAAGCFERASRVMARSVYR